MANNPDMLGKVADGLKADSEGFVHTSRIQTPGTIIDDQGHVWTVPADDSFDDAKLYRSPFDIKQHPDFYYQFERKEWVPGMMAEGFVPCTREEVGIGVAVNSPNAPQNEFSAGAASTYIVDDQLVCLKIPKVLEQRKRKALKRLADAAVRATEPRKKGETMSEYQTRVNEQPTSRSDPDRRDSAARMGSDTGSRKYDMRHETIIARPKHPEKEQI